MAALRGNHQLTRAGHRRYAGVVLPVLLLARGRIRSILLRDAARENDERHRAKRVLALQTLRPKTRELFNFERIHRRSYVLPARQCPSPHALGIWRQLGA